MWRAVRQRRGEGEARHGVAGAARQAWARRDGPAGLGLARQAWRGKAMAGEARPGVARRRQGGAGQGQAKQAFRTEPTDRSRRSPLPDLNCRIAGDDDATDPEANLRLLRFRQSPIGGRKSFALALSPAPGRTASHPSRAGFPRRLLPVRSGSLLRSRRVGTPSLAGST